MAALGFCYAMATPDAASRAQDQALEAPANGRVVGSGSLRFTNYLNASAQYDLGDCVLGTSVTRYLTCAGGVRPYRYVTAIDISPNSSFLPASSGMLAGSIGAGTPTGPLNFTVTLSDSLGTRPQSLNGAFMLNLYSYAGNVFRFAVDNINNGVLGQSYVSKLDTLGGNVPVVYSVVPGTLTLDGVSKGIAGGLEAIGLSLAEDGTLYGKPLQAGRVQFTARAVDGRKRTAQDRGAATNDQVISFNIENNTIAATDLVTLGFSISGDLGKAGRDSIKFAGQFNLSGAPSSALVGSPFVLRVGKATYEGRINGKGLVVNAAGGPLIFPDGARLRASVQGSTGIIKGTLSKANLANLLDAAALRDSSKTRLAVGLIIANSQRLFTSLKVGIVGSDTVDFDTTVRGNKFRLDYQLGRRGQLLGGAFQLLNVKGGDQLDNAGSPGNVWSVKFVAVPQYGIADSPGLDAISQINVRIGTRFNQQLSLKRLTTSGKGKITLAPGKPLGPVLAKFQLDPVTFAGSLTTNPVSQHTTGLPTAALEAQRAGGTSGAPSDLSVTFFDMGLDIARGSSSAYTGECGKEIYLKAIGGAATISKRPGKQWLNEITNQ